MTFTTYNAILKSFTNGIFAEIFKIDEGIDDSIFYNGQFEENELEIFNSFLDEYAASDELKEDLLLELKTNTIESADKTLESCIKLVEDINEKIWHLLSLLDAIDYHKETDSVDEDYVFNVILSQNANFYRYINSKSKSKESIGFIHLIYMLCFSMIGIKNAIIEAEISLIDPKNYFENSVKLLYMEFSGTLEFLKEKIDGNKNVSNIKLSETLSFLCNGKPSTYKVLLSQLGPFLQKGINKVFNKDMVETAVLQLHKDGFNTDKLSAILLKTTQ